MFPTTIVNAIIATTFGGIIGSITVIFTVISRNMKEENERIINESRKRGSRIISMFKDCLTDLNDLNQTLLKDKIPESWEDRSSLINRIEKNISSLDDVFTYLVAPDLIRESTKTILNNLAFVFVLGWMLYPIILFCLIELMPTEWGFFLSWSIVMIMIILIWELIQNFKTRKDYLSFLKNLI